MKRLSIISACILVAASAWSQATKILTAEKSNEYGIVYSLPQTALEIEVSVRHTVEKKGPFYLYAKKYIGTADVVTEDSEKWEITGIKVTPYGVPDSGTQYLMQLKAGSPVFVAVDADGMLLAINKEVSAPGRYGSNQSAQTQTTRWPDGKEYLDFVDEDFIASKSPARQAQLLAETLMEVRESRLSLTRGTADAMPTDGKQLELMLNSLAEQETAMTEAFTGSVTTESATRTFSFIPEGDGKEILFRLSDFAGFVDADDLSGDAVNIEISTANRPKLPVDAKGEEKKLPKNAVIYNLPGSAQVTISTLGKTLYYKELNFAQFGITFGLDPSLFSDKKQPSFATFDPVTGALMETGSVKQN